MNVLFYSEAIHPTRVTESELSIIAGLAMRTRTQTALVPLHESRVRTSRVCSLSESATAHLRFSPSASARLHVHLRVFPASASCTLPRRAPLGSPRPAEWRCTECFPGVSQHVLPYEAAVDRTTARATVAHQRAAQAGQHAEAPRQARARLFTCSFGSLTASHQRMRRHIPSSKGWVKELWRLLDDRGSVERLLHSKACDRQHRHTAMLDLG